MKASGNYIFKIADNEKEFNQIHKLNYHTFVEEIPQKNENKDKILIDQFHNENTYIICKKSDNNDLIGMLAVRGNRPFSLDVKIPELDKYLPEHSSPCEVRMLSIIPEYRKGIILMGLLCTLYPVVREQFDLIVISGYSKRIKLYQQMGFIPFAYPVGKKGALYQPMYLKYEDSKYVKLVNKYKLKI